MVDLERKKSLSGKIAKLVFFFGSLIVLFIFFIRNDGYAKYGILDSLSSALFGACLIYFAVSIFIAFQKPRVKESGTINKGTPNFFTSPHILSYYLLISL